MALGTFIAGVKVKILAGTRTISDAIEERSTASFTIVDEAGTGSYERGQAVEINMRDKNGAEQNVFKGVVDTTRWTRPAPGEGQPVKYHAVTCIDWHYLADKRLVARSYVGQTAGAIVNDLITTYLAAEGVTAGTIETGPVVLETVFNYSTAAECIQAIADAAGFWWYIDRNKALHMRARESVVAPWVVTADDIAHQDAAIERGNPQYRNRQFIRGGTDETDVQVESFKGDGVSESFTVGYPLAKVPTVKVNSVTQTRAIKGLGDVAQWYWSKGDPVITQDNAETRLTVADTLEITYQGQFAVVTLSTDEGEIVARQAVEGGTGFVDDVFDDAKLNTRESAFATGAALLEKYATIGRKTVFRTRRPGLAPTQLVHLQLPLHGVDDNTFLITHVAVSGNLEAEWTVTAVEGPWAGSWQRLFKNLLARTGDIIELVNTASDQTLVVLSQFPESWTWGETFPAVTVFACPIPATTLLPSASLLPC